MVTALKLLLWVLATALVAQWLVKRFIANSHRRYKAFLKRSLASSASSPLSPSSRLRPPPIDVVYSWIDGNHPEVVKQLKYWRRKLNPSGETATANRFQNMDELKYSLRSVREYAPWVRNIYVVTSLGLIPEWFDVEQGARRNVFFIDDSKLLEDTPVFNSLAKESVLHRIPGLSECYLYFNDDFFFGSPVSPGDFLTADGKAKVFWEAKLIPTAAAELAEDDYFQRGLIWTKQLFHRIERSLPRRLPHEHLFFKKHTPDIHFVSEDKLKWHTVGPELQRTSRAKFRGVNQVFDNSLFDYCWKLARGKAVIDADDDALSYYYLSLQGKPLKETWGFNEIYKRRPKVFCINDNLVRSNMLTRGSVARFKEFLELYFPRKAPWEK